eukprot:666490-Amphidinium_carterae.3
MGPFPPSYPKKFQYALIGAYRGKVAETGLPSPLPSVPLKTKEGPEVADAIRKFIESLHTGMYEEGKRIFVVFSDSWSEFKNPHVTDILNDLAIHQDFTSGYSPQSSVAAEVNVRTIKQVIRRLLEAASLQVPWWSHPSSTRHRFFNVVHCQRLGIVRLLESVSVRKLEDKKKQGAFAPQGELGRLLVVRPQPIDWQ